MSTVSADWEVRLRPGCYAGPDAPLISKHDTLRDAVRAARKSDRLQVERSDRAGCVWHPPNRRSRYGAGLYGTGPRRGEPTIEECVMEALANLSRQEEADGE